MSKQYPVLDNRPIDQWKVVELKEELRRRNSPIKGLKEELVKRLDEAIRKEMEFLNGEDASSDSQGIHSEVEAELALKDKDENETAADKSDKIVSDAIIVDTSVNEGAKVEDVAKTEDVIMDGTSVVLNEINVTRGDNKDTQFESSDIDLRFDEKHEELKVDTNDGAAYVNEGVKVGDMPTMNEESLDKEVERTDNGTTYANTDVEVEDKDRRDGTILDGKVEEEAVNTVSFETKESGAESVITQYESSDNNLNLDEKHEECKPSIEGSMLIPAGPNNQVPMVSPDLQVKCDSYSSDSVSMNEMNKPKDNLNADNSHLELEVMPEMVQLSSSNVPPIVEELEPGKNQDSLEEVDANDAIYATNMELCKNEDNADGGSPEKLNLDRSSGDESIEEDVLESKLIDSSSKSDDAGERKEVIKVNVVEEGNQVISSTGALSLENMDIVAEEKVVPVAPMQKRKPEADEVRITEGSKRVRRWNTETIKAPELQSSNISSSSAPKDSFQPQVKRIFARSDSITSVDSPKERIVPPSTKPATNSLKIDRFLRPFTLKAVQELLARTGTVCNFWMDHIKTHCYVSYSSVEEATATRDSVYNLQWPPNGGRLLTAEFVNPQEVKTRAEAPKPISPGPTTPISPAFQQKPGPPAARLQQQQTLRQKLPPPPPLPLPPPAVARELPPPPTVVRQLPSPPPLKKPEPTVVTLDDLFKKTTATPRIYYLPLSEEQVAAKIATQGIC